MIYLWKIKQGEEFLACGVVSATNGKEAETLARGDWGIKSGDFSYSSFQPSLAKKESVLLYKKKGVE